MFGGKIGLPELVVVLLVVIVIVKIGRARVLGAVLLGMFLGAFVGFLLRPSSTLAGQLPFETVITRGTELRGLSALALRSTAEQSFNYMVIGILVGGALLSIWAAFLNKLKPQTVHVQSAAVTPGSSTAAVTSGSSRAAFCTKCGKPLADGVEFCGACGRQRG